VARSLAISGLTLTIVGAFVLAWLDLSGKRRTWATLVTEPAERKRAAWLGFPLIVVGSALQIAGVAYG
jgi:hypothetical protein